MTSYSPAYPFPLRMLPEKLVTSLLVILGLLVGLIIMAVFVRTLMVPYIGVDISSRDGKWYINRAEDKGTAYRDGIRRGDEVVTLNGLRPEEVAGGTVFVPSYRIESIEVIDAVGRSKQSSASAGPVTSEVIQESTSVFVVGIAFWLVGFLCFLRRPQSKLVQWLYVMSLAVALAPILPLGAPRGWDQVRALETVNGVLAPWLIVRFFLEFPSEKRLRVVGRDLTWLVYVPPIVFMVAYALVGHQDAVFYSWFRPLIVLNLAIGFLLALGITAYSYFATSFGRSKQQLRIVIAGAATGMLPLITLVVLPDSLGQPYILPPHIAVIGLVAIPLSLGYVILRHRLLDIDRIVSRILSYGLLFCSFVAGYMAMNWVVSLILPESGIGWRITIILVFAAVATALSAPAKARISRFVDSLINRGRYDYRQAASGIMEEISSQTELQGLTRILASSIGRFLRLDGACVLLLDKEKGWETSATSGVYAEDFAKRRELLKWCGKLDESQLFPNKAPAESGAAFFVPLYRDKKQVGMMVLGNKSGKADFSVDDNYFLFTIANQASLAVDNALLLQQARAHAAELEVAYNRLKQYAVSLEDSRRTLEQAYIDMIRTLVLAIESRNQYTKQHSERVARLARRIGAQMGLNQDQLHNLEVAGRIHDIGKIGISDNILLKTGPLEHHERAEVELHTVRGVEIVRFLGFLKNTIPIIESHHEWYNGAGYPRGLRGEEIPLEARIAAVADAYDAMTSDRPHRKARTSEEAAALLKEGAGKQWDPNVVDAMLHLVKFDNEAR